MRPGWTVSRGGTMGLFHEPPPQDHPHRAAGTAQAATGRALQWLRRLLSRSAVPYRDTVVRPAQGCLRCVALACGTGRLPLWSDCAAGSGARCRFAGPVAPARQAAGTRAGSVRSKVDRAADGLRLRPRGGTRDCAARRLRRRLCRVQRLPARKWPTMPIRCVPHRSDANQWHP